MDDIEFDKVFSEFLGSPEYSKADECFFELTKAAFMAGWKAAIASQHKAAGDAAKK